MLSSDRHDTLSRGDDLNFLNIHLHRSLILRDGPSALRDLLLHATLLLGAHVALLVVEKLVPNSVMLSSRVTFIKFIPLLPNRWCSLLSGSLLSFVELLSVPIISIVSF